MCFKNLTQFQIRVHKPHPISDQNRRNLYPIFQTKTAQKPYPLAPHIPTMLKISGCPVVQDDLKCVRATSF